MRTAEETNTLARALADVDPALVCAAPELLAALEALVNEPQPLGIDRQIYQCALRTIDMARGTDRRRLVFGGTTSEDQMLNAPEAL